MCIGKVVASFLEGCYNAFCHTVVVADYEFDHVASAFVISYEVGVHVVFCCCCGPLTAKVYLVTCVFCCGSIEILKSGFACCFENDVSVFYAILGSVDSFDVCFVTFHECIRDNAVAVEVNCIIVSNKIVTDHFALHVACFGSIGTDEASVCMCIKNRNISAVGADCAVEEYYGNVACSCKNFFCCVNRTGSYKVYNEKGGTTSDSGFNLVELFCLVVCCKLVVIFDTECIEFFVECRTYSAEINISFIVPEYGNFSSAFRSGAAAGCKAEDHYESESQCKNFFHY